MFFNLFCPVEDWFCLFIASEFLYLLAKEITVSVPAVVEINLMWIVAWSNDLKVADCGGVYLYKTQQTYHYSIIHLT